MASRGIVYDLHIIETYYGLPYTLRIQTYILLTPTRYLNQKVKPLFSTFILDC